MSCWRSLRRRQRPVKGLQDIRLPSADRSRSHLICLLCKTIEKIANDRVLSNRSGPRRLGTVVGLVAVQRGVRRRDSDADPLLLRRQLRDRRHVLGNRSGCQPREETVDCNEQVGTAAEVAAAALRRPSCCFRHVSACFRHVSACFRHVSVCQISGVFKKSGWFEFFGNFFVRKSISRNTTPLLSWNLILNRIFLRAIRNHRKKKKTEPRRLVPRKLTVSR